MLRTEKGITLVALIITIIVLVILAAVSITAAYQSGIIKYAVNGTTAYSQQAVNENGIMSKTESLVSDSLSSIYSILSTVVE